MKIAIFHELLIKLGGAERVAKKFLEIFPQADFYTLLYDKASCSKIFPANKVNVSPLQKYFKWIKKPQLLLTKMPAAVESMDFSSYDLVITSSSAFAHGIITPTHTKHICYCHSPMRYVWDWKNEYLKEQRKTFLGSFKKLILPSLLHKIRTWDQGAADRPDLYIANSKNTQKRIKKYYREHCLVIYPPVDISRFSVSKKSEDYFLIVSALTPFKRIDLAIRTFNRIGKKLVIIGSGKQKRYLRSISEDNIEFLGYKSDRETTNYYQNCRAFIFPGEEDFGITPIEALACGKPVLAYFKGGVKESVREGRDGEFFYKPTPESLEDGLARLIANSKKYKTNSLRKQAEKFSSEIFNLKIRKVVDDIMKS